MILSLDQVPRGSPVLIVTCVSSRKQSANHRDQRLNLKSELVSRRIKIKGSHQYTGQRYNPEWIIPAVDKGLKLNAEYLVFESSDRILRNPQFNCSYNPNAVASTKQFLELKDYLQGIKLAVLIPPDTSASLVRSAQRKRGIMGKEKTLRGRYKHHKHETIQKARKLNEKGYSLRQISLELGVAKSTISDWISRVSE